MATIADPIIAEVKNSKVLKDQNVVGALRPRIRSILAVNFTINVVVHLKHVDQTATRKFYLV